ncbi:MAG: hypothetical protein K6G18_00490 [Treponema sp.]|nr:hypothetical protein [Treponema sp.]MCR5620316.1 hypothetical protein [Treponema sp.]
MEDVKYSEIQRQLRDSARRQAVMLGTSGGELFCNSPELEAPPYGEELPPPDCCGDCRAGYARDCFRCPGQPA